MHIILCPKTYEGKYDALTFSPLAVVGDKPLAHFVELPPKSIVVAFATLLSAELLEGEVLFEVDVPKEWLAPFDNIEYFQPDGKHYHVLT